MKVPHDDPPFWTGDLTDVAYIYYQGILASQVQAGRYIGTNTMVLTTGEVAAFSQSGVQTIPLDRLWVYPEIQEIQRDTRVGTTGRMEHLSHGISITRNTGELPYQPLYPTDEQGTLHHYSINGAESSFGQVTDIRDHKRRYDALMTAQPHIRNVVMHGTSRGGATTFSALAEHQYEHVKLCILEAPPSSVSGILKNYAARLGSSKLGRFLYNPLAYFMLGKQYVHDKANQPRGHVDRFPVDVPLVIISSVKDGVIPIENSLRLALRVAAHRLQSSAPNVQPVYFLQLNNEGHNTYTRPGSSDSERYNNLVHAAYKKHGLPFNEQAALRGEKELEQANLMSGTNRQLVEEQIRFWQDSENRPQIRNQALAKLFELRKEKLIDRTQLELYEQMPVFSKSLGFFQSPSIQEQFDALKAEPSSTQLEL